MKKRIISFILTLTLLFSFVSVCASAASGEEYISDVALVYEDSVEAAKEAIAGTEWKLYEQDLNPKADYWFDDGVYLIYKTSTDVEDWHRQNRRKRKYRRPAAHSGCFGWVHRG